MSTAPSWPRPCRASTPNTPGDRLLQDLHHAGDHGQRRQRAALVPRQRRRGKPVVPAFRRGLDQCGGRARLRHRPGQYVRILGLGRRTLRSGPRWACRSCWRSATMPSPNCWPAGAPWTNTSARPAAGQHAGRDGDAGHLVPQFLRHVDQLPRALLDFARTVSGLPATAGDGEQRQVGPAGRAARPRPHVAGGMGQRRHQRPARLLPDDPPGLADRAGGLHRAVAAAALLPGAPSCWPTASPRPRR